MKGFFNRTFGFVVFSVASLQLMSCAPSTSLHSQNYQPENSDSGQIIGGTLTDNNFAMRNGVVGVYDFERGATCTGSLLPNSIVLTAAHCINNPRSTLIIFDASITKFFQLVKEGKMDEARAIARPVVLAAINGQYHSFNSRVRDLIKEKVGQATAISEEQKREIRDAIGEIKDQGDIALLSFQGVKPAGYLESDLMKPSELSSITDGSQVMLAGYGIDDGPKKTGSNVLRMVDGITVSQSKFAATEVVVDQRNGKGACHGDSGGPAYSRVMVNGRPVLKLWGVTSRGYRDEKNDCSQFAIYTNAVAWNEWVTKASAALVERMKSGTQAPAVPKPEQTKTK